MNQESRPTPEGVSIIDDLRPERELLGSLILDEAALPLAAGFAAVDFEDPRHGVVFTAVCGLQQRGAPVSLVTVHAELRALDSTGQVSLEYLVEIAQSVTSSAHAAHHAKIVSERSLRRQASLVLAQASKEIQETAVGQGLVYEALERVKAELPAPRTGEVPLGSIETVCLADVESKPISWLWPGRIALGKLTLLAGDPGLGKSTLALDIAARVSCGASWPDVSDVSAPGRVLIATAEDALDDTVRPRLEAVGANLVNIVAVKSIRTREGERGFSLEVDLRALERKVAALEGLRLLVIDPVTAFLGATDSHKNSDVRGILAPLATLAEKHAIAVLAVTHLNKAQSQAIYRALGSIAFVAAARAAWFIAKDKQDPSRRLMLEGKNNVGHASGLAFRVDSALGPQATSVPVIHWESDPVTITLDEALAPPEGGSQNELDRVCDFLRSELADRSVPACQIQQGARANGISEKTLNRAKKELGVVVRKGGFSGGWTWSLHEDGQAGHSRGLATFDDFGHLRPEGAENGALSERSGLNGSEDGQGSRMATFDSEEVDR